MVSILVCGGIVAGQVLGQMRKKKTVGGVVDGSKTSLFAESSTATIDRPWFMLSIHPSKSLSLICMQH